MDNDRNCETGTISLLIIFRYQTFPDGYIIPMPSIAPAPVPADWYRHFVAQNGIPGQ
jgi:hypothetical protein